MTNFPGANTRNHNSLIRSFIVMAGLDPAIRVDARLKAGHDEAGWVNQRFPTVGTSLKKRLSAEVAKDTRRTRRNFPHRVLCETFAPSALKFSFVYRPRRGSSFSALPRSIAST